MVAQWHWLRLTPGMADGAAYSRLFQSRGTASELIAREVTQNSWDAAQRLKKEILDSTSTFEVPKFRMEYEFRSLSGKAKESLVAGLQLRDLKARLDQRGHADLGFDEGNVCLDILDGDAAIPVLYIHDFGATGLRGDPVAAEPGASDFFRAFASIGGNDRKVGGGSYGFGKSAFIRASRIRTVVAYSSFKDDGDGVTRRLWGFAYWKGDNALAGLAQLGPLKQGQGGEMSVPLTNQEADNLAKLLGFHQRTGDTPAEWGTSLMVVDHVLDEQDLCTAIENFWWPALKSFGRMFEISVFNEQRHFEINPDAREHLKPFLRAFALATNGELLAKDGEFRASLPAMQVNHFEPGEMALVKVDVPDEDALKALTKNDQVNLVALIREPRMVAKYQDFRSKKPNIQGVFVANPKIDQYLRKSEPDTHDLWSEELDEGMPDLRITKSVVKGVRLAIQKEFSRVFKLLMPKREGDPGTLSIADSLLAKAFPPTRSGVITDPKKPKKRKTRMGTFEVTSSKNFNDDSLILREIWTFSPTTKLFVKPLVLQFRPRLSVVADGESTSSDDQIQVSFEVIPEGFDVLPDGRIQGVVHQGQVVTFSTVSDPYEADWTVTSDVTVASLNPDEVRG
jgi:hypothetical protein